uniref:GDP-Man:Man(3)GlcNAc(2)-PP-Dol alpha-1,2-mannosyltransferase n=1 Tax=Parastrongyloides trichosuri TaxID=131310 RepID=A0A0N4ZMT7_PARTI
MGILVSLFVILLLPSIPCMILLSLYLRLTKNKNSVAFFHPYCNAGGGGERVLWCAINGMQERLRWLLEASNYPRFTMILQTLAAYYVGMEALLKFNPEILIDTMGYPFVLPLFKWIGGCKVGCYVHYPTISTDMISMVENRESSYNNAEWISKSTFLSFGKLIYYKLFALFYKFCGFAADVVMVNGTWTEGHINTLWNRKAKKIFPPCNVDEFINLKNISEDIFENEKIVQILSVGQIRPEKNHKLQLEAFAKAKNMLGDVKLKLIIVGGCRNEDDIERYEKLKDYGAKLSIADDVIWKINCPFDILLEFMSTSLIGIHTMINEHFGISVVEQMAAENIMISNNSGGPMMDIIVDKHPLKNAKGFLATSADEYASAIISIIKLSKLERDVIRKEAKKQSEIFSDKAFDEKWYDSMKSLMGE